MSDKEMFTSFEFFSNQLQSRHNIFSLNRGKFYIWTGGFHSFWDSFYRRLNHIHFTVTFLSPLAVKNFVPYLYLVPSYLKILC